MYLSPSDLEDERAACDRKLTAGAGAAGKSLKELLGLSTYDCALTCALAQTVVSMQSKPLTTLYVIPTHG